MVGEVGEDGPTAGLVAAPVKDKSITRVISAESRLESMDEERRGAVSRSGRVVLDALDDSG